MIEVRGLSRDAFGDRDAFLRRFVREHRPRHRVPNRPDPFRARAAILVDDNAAVIVETDAGRGRVETLSVRAPADRDDEPIECALVLSAGILVTDHDAVSVRARAGHPCSEPDVEPLPGERLQRLARDPSVRGGEEVVERLEDRHLGAEPPPHAAELEADDPRSDDAEPSRDIGERERAFVVDNAIAIDLGDPDPDRNRAGGKDDVPRGQAPALAGAVQGDLDPAISLEGGETRDRFDLVLAQQAGDPAGQGLHHLVLAREHPAEIELYVARIDAVRGQQVAYVVIVVRRIEKRLRWDAPDVQARSAESRSAAWIEPGVHARRREPELRGPDRRDVPAGAGSDDHDVEIVHRIFLSIGARLGATARRSTRIQTSSSSRAGSSMASFTHTRNCTASRPSMMR